MESRFILMEEIGHGRFGRVVAAQCKRSGSRVAIKIEHVDAPFRLLRHESTFLDHLNRHHCIGVPLISWFGMSGKGGLAMAMTFLDGPCLNQSKQKLDWIQVSKLLDILKNVHELGILHRDIKPDNFKWSNQTQSYILYDFGFAISYLTGNGVHRTEEETQGMVIGTPAYMSLHVQRGHVASRRDDVISLAYVALGPHLPWANVTNWEQLEKAKMTPNSWLIWQKWMDSLMKLEYAEEPLYQVPRLVFDDQNSRGVG